MASSVTPSLLAGFKTLMLAVDQGKPFTGHLARMDRSQCS